ncbi:hypothetical protein [Cohnella panacarvi]|uniref:hypothetical protein n=1 Tax=Cohnella panacarvi TaxID=400776 RepID=UPI00047D8195|nr:hypothetical protein [Cohnella panacarvi]
MTGYGEGLSYAIGWLLQFALAFVSIAALLKALTSSRNRWRIHLKDWRLHRSPRWWLALWRASAESAALQERRVLLAGCGIRFPPDSYLAYRRFSMAMCLLVAGILYLLARRGIGFGFASWNIGLAIGILFVAIAYDHALLQAFKRYRTDRIRKEIVSVCSQLLYYTGSRLHLHAKLMKCLPLTRGIRNEMNLLLNEWYHDADASLKRFKERLGTEEAYGFAETLRSLRLDESESIYDLLREVVREYKNKTELAKNSRKETTSYLLFVLAGIPILYMFQIFLYPWVREAAKLFDALNP